MLKEDAMGRRRGVAGFSWKRASGLSAAKSKLSRHIGVPLTRAGRQRKVAKALGCCVPAAFLLLGGLGAAVGFGKAIVAWAV